MGGFAWVTLATNDSYSLGALVLAHSLKQSGTQQQLAVLVTPGVTNAMREKLATVFNLVQEVNILDSKDEANLRLLKRPELGVTFTKLHCWRLTQFDKCVFLDADTLVLQNCDELFEREELSAAPDVGWPDCFNSGVFVYRPSYDTYEKLVQFALEKGSFDGGDQGLLNSYFSDWAHKDISRHLPFIYNMCSTACYSYLPAFQQFGANAKIIHFIGSTKPWLQYFDTETRTVQPSGGAEHLRGVLQHWWNIFCTLIHPNLSPQMTRSSSVSVHSAPSQYPPYVPPPSNNQYQQQYAPYTAPSYNSHNDYQPQHPTYEPNIPSPNPRDYISHSNESHHHHFEPSPPTDDYQNVWDPWEEYDSNQIPSHPHQETTSDNHTSQTPYIEPLNTNAYSNEAVEKDPEPFEYHPEPTEHHYHYEVPTTPVPQNFATPVPQNFTTPVPQNFTTPVPQNFTTPVPQNFDIIHHHHETPPPVHEYYENPETSQYSNNSYEPPPIIHVDTHFDNPPETIPVAHPVETECPREKTTETYPETNSGPFPEMPSECETTSTVSNETQLHVCTNEEPPEAGLAGAFAQLTLGEPRTAEQNALDDHLRRQGWEVGNIDYLGRDSFDNIWSKICQTLAEAPPQPVTTKPKEPTPPPVTKPDQPAEEVQQTLPQPVEQTTPKETSGDQVATEIPTPVVEPDIIIPLEDTAPKETAQPETNVSIAEIPAAKVAEVPTSPAQDLAQPPLESSTVSTPLEAKESLAAVQAPPEQVTPKTTTQVPVISPEQTSVPATPEPIIPVQTETKSPEPENASIAAVPVEKVPTPQQEPPTEVSKVEEPSVPSTQTTTELVTKSEEATVPAALTASTTAAEAPVPTEPATEAPAPKSLEPEASLVQVPTEHVPETPVPKSLEPEPSLVQIPTEHVTETPVSKVPEAEPSHTQVPAEPVTETPLPKLPEPEPSLAPVPAEPVTEAPSPKLQEPEPLVPIPSAPPTETAPKPAEATAPPTNVCPVLSKKHTESSKLQSDRPSKKTPKTSSPKPTPPSTPTETPKTLLTTAKSAETPKTPEVTQATPPTSPLAQDVVATQQKSKQSELGVSTAVPETPPPTGSAGAVPTPTPPPRKAGASTKKTTKSKKQ